METLIHSFESLMRSNALEVPVFQRPYRWDDDLLERLWEDLGVLYSQGSQRKPKRPDHFMGILLIGSPRPHRAFKGISSREIIDGQQRLITLTILLCAMRDHFRAGMTEDRPYADLLTIKGLMSAERVVAQRADREALQACVRGEFTSVIPGAHLKSRVVDAYWFFRRQLAHGERSLTKEPAPPERLPRRRGRGAGSDVPLQFSPNRAKRVNEKQLQGIVKERLSFVCLLVEPADEPPEAIFESINGLRLPLSQFDHIRNALFVRLGDEAEALFFKEWEPMEQRLESIAQRFVGTRRTEMGDLFLHSYLVAEGARVNQGQVFSEVTSRLSRDSQGRTGIEAAKALLSDLLDALPYFDAAVARPRDDMPSDETTGVLSTRISLPIVIARPIENIQTLSAGPPAPFVMLILSLWHEGSANRLRTSQAAKLLGYVEALLVRMTLAGVNLSPMRGWFTSLTAKIASELQRHPRQDAFKLIDLELRTRLSSQGVVPSDDQVREGLLENPAVYTSLGSDITFLLLRGMNDRLVGGRPKDVVRNELQVEHIFPQSLSSADKLRGSAWGRELEAWGTTREERRDLIAARHHLGNLTLHRHNARLSDKSFSEKKALLRAESTAIADGHGVAALSINRKKRWRVQEVEARTRAMVEYICKTWPTPPQSRSKL